MSMEFKELEWKDGMNKENNTNFDDYTPLTTNCFEVTIMTHNPVLRKQYKDFKTTTLVKTY